MKNDKIASIDCCEHKFCFQCIDDWTSKRENSCPLCKAVVKEIKHKTGKNGREVVKKVKNKSIGPRH